MGDCSGGAAACTVGVNAGNQGGKTGFGPLLPVVSSSDETVTVKLHAIVDHTIVEAIFNNRTAMVVYSVPKAETDVGVMLFGADSTTVKATLQTWNLRTPSADTQRIMHVSVHSDPTYVIECIR